MKTVIEIKNLVKTFGAFAALKGVNLGVYPGEVPAHLGDNGTGKSTLIKIRSNVFLKTADEKVVEGAPLQFRTPRDAAATGIGTDYQELALTPLMAVSRNFVPGANCS